MLKRYCDIHGLDEKDKLEAGIDFRRPEYRREVFKRFYGFHTSYGIHPGLVYLYLPEIAKREGWDMEQRLWAAFLEGCCENPCTMYYVTRFFPRLPRTLEEIERFSKWHAENWRKLAYDIDTRYNKGHLVEQTISYIKALAGRSQEAYFYDLYDPDPRKWFDSIWKASVKLYKFGRLTTWSYLEFVKILSGFDFEFSSFMMRDISGSKSHRNGLLKVLGRDDLEMWSKLDNGITTHPKALCDALEHEGFKLLNELKERYSGESWSGSIGVETLESALCAFKNFFRGYRYPNIYTDMSFDRIKKAERLCPEADFGIFWEIRRDKLPVELLVECQPNDCGLTKEKQAYFSDTGKLPMMSVYDPVFACGWDKRITNKTK